MPYKIKGKCIFKKSNNKKIGCTKGSVKKYLSALYANVKDINESDVPEWVEDITLDGMINPDGTINFIPPIGTRVSVDTEDESTGEKFNLNGEVVLIYPKSVDPSPYFVLKIDGGWQSEYGWDCDVDYELRSRPWAENNKCWYVYPLNLNKWRGGTMYNNDKVKILKLNKINESGWVEENITPIKGRNTLNVKNKSNTKLGEMKESEGEFYWAEELLKDIENGVDVTVTNVNSEDANDKIKFLESLPIGSILNLTGYQDGLEIEGVEAEIISENIGGNVYSQYLFKFPKVYNNEDGESTHCGVNSAELCDCQDEVHDIGKCWWVDLKYMDKVIYYPKNPNEIKENKKEKSLITEGRYDAITRKAVNDIMKSITKGDSDTYILPLDISDEDEYVQEGMAFSIELYLDWSGHDEKNEPVKTFKVMSVVLKTEKDYDDDYDDDYDEEEVEDDVISINIYFGPEFTKNNLEELFFKLQEDVRHEIEHLTQEGPYRIEDRPIYKGNTAKFKTVLGHHKNIVEVPAMVRGFYRRAKLEKKPLDQVMRDDLNYELERGGLTKRGAEKLFNIWIDYAKKNLPKAKYKRQTYLP